MGRREINVFLFYIIAGITKNKTAHVFKDVALSLLSFTGSASRTIGNREEIQSQSHKRTLSKVQIIIRISKNVWKTRERNQNIHGEIKENISYCTYCRLGRERHSYVFAMIF